MPVIRGVKAIQVFNSRGDQTLEIEVWVNGTRGTAIAPSGASVGKHEAIMFPDQKVTKALEIISEVAKKLSGVDGSNPQELTERLKEMDGTPNLSRIGGAVAYGVTVAAASAYAKIGGEPLYRHLARGVEHSIPVPLGNIVGGGMHAKAPRMDVQELLVAPIGARNVREAVETMFTIHRRVGSELASKDPGYTGGRGDEGAWTSSLNDVQLLGILRETVDKVQSELGFRIGLGVDVASSTLWDESRQVYHYRRNGFEKTRAQQIDYIAKLIQDFDLTYVEDPFHEEDFDSFTKLTSTANKTFICGDDLVTTNLARLNYAIEAKACNTVVMKVNQAGYLWDALAFSVRANTRGLKVVASHRSGDNPDEILAHLAIASRSKLIKTGVIGGERVSKLNELIRIEEHGLKLSRVNLDE